MEILKDLLRDMARLGYAKVDRDWEDESTYIRFREGNPVKSVHKELLIDIDDKGSIIGVRIF